jgi:hypothetical protein
VAQEVECLLCKLEDLRSNPSTAKRKKKEGAIYEGWDLPDSKSHQGLDLGFQSPDL